MVMQESSSKNSNAMHMGGPSFAPYLEKVAFPQSRKAILQLAEENEDDDKLLSRFREIPNSVYDSVEDVRKALGEEYENYGVVKKTEEKNVQASQSDRR